MYLYPFAETRPHVRRVNMQTVVLDGTNDANSPNGYLFIYLFLFAFGFSLTLLHFTKPLFWGVAI